MDRELIVELKYFNMFLNVKLDKMRKEHRNKMPVINAVILKYLIENKNKVIFQKDIEEEFAVRKSRLSKILSSMEEDDYIKRIAVKEDARLKQIILGDEGKKLNAHIIKGKKDIQNMLLKGVEEEDLSIFYDVLDKITENAKNDIN